jgi:1-acyl-sn-glycerol-3-phosphate acyltransferase
VRIPSFHWWRTVFFLIPTIAIYTIVLGTVSIASSFFGGRGYFAHRCARAWSWLILVTTGVRVQVSGLDELVLGTTYVFVSNHQSIYDIPVVFWSLPYQVRIIAKQSLGSFPFLGWHLRRSGHLLVNRRNPDRSRILGHWRELVKLGLSLIIFPEGTRSPDGQVGRFKAGKGQLTTRPGSVTLSVHRPIHTADGTWAPTVDDAKRLAADVHAVIAGRVEAKERAAGTWRESWT